MNKWFWIIGTITFVLLMMSRFAFATALTAFGLGLFIGFRYLLFKAREVG